MSTIEEPILLTSMEAAAKLRLTVQAVSRRCQRGEIPGAFRTGRLWRIPAVAIQSEIDAAVALAEAAVAEAVRRSTAASGVPERLEDPAAGAAVAEAFRSGREAA